MSCNEDRIATLSTPDIQDTKMGVGSSKALGVSP